VIEGECGLGHESAGVVDQDGGEGEIGRCILRDDMDESVHLSPSCVGMPPFCSWEVLTHRDRRPSRDRMRCAMLLTTVRTFPLLSNDSIQ
jgi:hypothetical protein